jgi:hypothetical protein
VSAVLEHPAGYDWAPAAGGRFAVVVESSGHRRPDLFADALPRTFYRWIGDNRVRGSDATYGRRC